MYDPIFINLGSFNNVMRYAKVIRCFAKVLAAIFETGCCMILWVKLLNARNMIAIFRQRLRELYIWFWAGGCGRNTGNHYFRVVIVSIMYTMHNNCFQILNHLDCEVSFSLESVTKMREAKITSNLNQCIKMQHPTAITLNDSKIVWNIPKHAKLTGLSP
jgi:hypothetical protein